jgi:hypothetical protein
MKVWMRPARGRERPAGAVDVAGRAAGERRPRPAATLGDPAHGLGVVVDAIGNPASMMSTPSVELAGQRSFSSTRIENPGACSPSRSVVSKMTSRSGHERQSLAGPPKVKVMFLD